MVPFAGWEMPLSYSGVPEEHHAVRTAVRLFDISHMGRFELSDREAEACLDHITLVGRAGIGVDNIDFTAATKRGIGGHEHAEPRAVAGRLVRASVEEKRAQIEAVASFKRQHADKAPQALKRLQEVVDAGGNTFAELMDTVRA